MGKNFSANSNDYKLLEEVGHGASAIVYRAIYLPSNKVVAVKCLDLDRCNSNLDDIRREAQTMSLIDHPNVIRAYCSFVVDHNLWVVMPFMSEGSCLHLMKSAYPDGFEESTIGSILKETLKALEYLHHHGHIHRDVKAGNILMDGNDEVKLADFGVSACMFDRGDRQRSRNTFVGTPCWMAPEVLQPGTGYDFKADIWSFGITALELAHGHAPFSKYPPMKVLLMTIQNAPPGLDYDRDKKFSKSFKEVVAMCLVKDQTKRPSAEKLLKHSFFKNAKPPQFSVKKLFANMPPLWKRVKDLELKDAAQLALKRMPSADEEAISQSSYQRGVSAWNFDIEVLKLQASLLQDEDIQEMEEEDNLKLHANHKVGSSNVVNQVATDSNIGRENTNDYEVPLDENMKGVIHESDLIGSENLRKSELKRSNSKTEIPPPVARPYHTPGGSLMPGTVLSHSLSERASKLERFEIVTPQVVDKTQQVRKAPSFSGPLMLPKRASSNSLSAPIKSSGGYKDSFEDKSRTNLVQKGRFSVTSEDVDIVKGSTQTTLKKSASVGNWVFDYKQMSNDKSAKEVGNSNMPASILMPQLQNLYQQTSIQQDLITNLLSSLKPVEVVDALQNGKLPPPVPRTSENNDSVELSVSERECMLFIKISELQARMISLTDELKAEKMKYMKLHHQLTAVSAREEDGDS